MLWFKHEVDAGRDWAKSEVMKRCGLEGYGLYYYLIEILAERAEGEENRALTLPAGAWAKRCGLSTVKFKRIARVLARNFLIKLSETRSGEMTIQCRRWLSTCPECPAVKAGLKELDEFDHGFFGTPPEPEHVGYQIQTWLRTAKVPDYLVDVPDEVIAGLDEMFVPRERAFDLAFSFGPTLLIDGFYYARAHADDDFEAFQFLLLVYLLRGPVYSPVKGNPYLAEVGSDGGLAAMASMIEKSGWPVFRADFLESDCARPRDGPCLAFGKGRSPWWGAPAGFAKNRPGPVEPDRCMGRWEIRGNEKYAAPYPSRFAGPARFLTKPDGSPGVPRLSRDDGMAIQVRPRRRDPPCSLTIEYRGRASTHPAPPAPGGFLRNRPGHRSLFAPLKPRMGR